MPENPASEDATQGPDETPRVSASAHLPSNPVRPARRHSFFRTALFFEFGLGAAALIAGWLFGLSADSMAIVPQHPVVSLSAAATWGVLAALPMIVALVWLNRHPPRILRSFRDQVGRQVVPLFRPLKVYQLALLALAAGVGEELLYRGLLQMGLQIAIGGSAGAGLGLLIASLVFGLCHYLNLTYALLAGLVGIYFGLLLIGTGHLIAPTVAHAVYDFAALIYLTRTSE